MNTILHCSVVLGMLVAVSLPLVGCRRSGTTNSSFPEVSTLDHARSELRSYIENVTQATASRYGVMDDQSNVMDTVKIIAVPEAGGYAGVYHTYRSDTGAFDVHLATSSDLMNWTWKVELASKASQPTIKPASDGGYVVAWEQEPDNHLKFAYYSSWTNLLNGVVSKTLDAPRRLSSCAEGTPNLYSASSTFLDVGFHFNANCELDRQARGTTDWRTWNPVEQPLLDRALLVHGVMGGVGDRDAISFEGFDFTLLEGQVIRDDWRSWRVFLHDDETDGAEQLNIRTHAGSVAFTNPTIEHIEIDGQKAILVTLFIPQEGAEGVEAGQLIYYRTYEPVDPG
jgi:hypothetical protein